MLALHFNIIGVLLIGLAFLHLIFPSYFNWKEELSQLSLMNKQMMQVHTFFIAFIVFLMGVLCLYSTNDLLNTSLGKTISLGFGIFWGVRLVFQFFGYSKELWKGKSFETIVHIAFSLLWMYLTAVFFVNALSVEL